MNTNGNAPMIQPDDVSGPAVDAMHTFGCSQAWTDLDTVLTLPDAKLLVFEYAMTPALVTAGPRQVVWSHAADRDAADCTAWLGPRDVQLYVSEPARYKLLCADRLAVCLAFFDAAATRSATGAPVLDAHTTECSPQRIAADMPAAPVHLARQVLDDDKTFRHWLISALLQRDCAALTLAGALRTREAYSLVMYLLQNHERSQVRLIDLCREYGLSGSYFRKLCKRILGQGAKSLFSQWRAVDALLEVVTQRCSILNVAINHGYSSASHISREIQSKFGHAPSAFRSAGGLPEVSMGCDRVR